MGLLTDMGISPVELELILEREKSDRNKVMIDDMQKMYEKVISEDEEKEKGHDGTI